MTVLLLCYGLFEPSNLQYKKYLDKALKYMSNVSVEHVVICGGLTSKNLQVSEAVTVSEYLISQQHSLAGKIILEEQSTTTPQNLEFARDILDKQAIKPTELLVLCDSIRLPKVYYLTLTYVSKVANISVSEEEIYLSLLDQSAAQRIDLTQDTLVTFESIQVQGIWIDRTPTEVGQQIISTMQEIAAEKYPSVEERILAIRKKQWELQQ